MIDDTSNLLEVKGLSFGYGGLQILSGMSFDLKPGEKVGLIGPNGAGKTTLLNIISGLLHPLKGEVYISGHEISRLPPHKRVSLGLGRCFQTNELFLEAQLARECFDSPERGGSLRFPDDKAFVLIQEQDQEELGS